MTGTKLDGRALATRLLRLVAARSVGAHPSQSAAA